MLRLLGWAIGKMQTCGPSTGKMLTVFANQVHILPTCRGHQWSSFSKPVGYVIHHLSVCLEQHTQRASQFSAVRCGNMPLPKRLGMTCCQSWRISHGHNDNISETVLDRDIITRDYIDKAISRYWSLAAHRYDIVGQSAPTISRRCHPTLL